MALFITSTSAATRHGVYAIERSPPATIAAPGASTTAIVEQFPWGPAGIYTIASVADFIQKYAPGGMDRTGAGYLAVIGKAWPVLKVVRVQGSGASAATATLASSAPTNLLTLTLKYTGATGNSVTWEVDNATDGDPNHFNLKVILNTSFGTTTDLLQNLNYSGTGADSVPVFTNMVLLGGITKLASGLVVRTTGSFSTGSDGTVTSTSYVGTQGSANQGIALLEADRNIDFVITGDPGNSLRAAVNAGLQAHADYMTDRMAFINGNSGMASSAAITDVANYRSIRTCYIDCWANQADDVTGALHLVGPAPFAASVAANLSPSTSFSWKSTNVQRLLTSIVSLETARGDQAYQQTLAGICTLQQEALGGYTFEAAVNTDAPIAPSKATYKRTRMMHYIAKAVVGSMREFVDSPNVAFNQQDEVNAVDNFLSGLKKAVKTDPNNTPHIVDYDIRPLGDFNTPSSIAGGAFTIAADVQISSDQSDIFFSLNIGETVTVQTTG